MTMLMMLMVQAPRLTGERPRNLRGCGSCCGGPFVALGFAEPTPRDEAHRGPIEPQELLPRDPPPPEPVCAHALSLSFGMQWGTMLWARTLTRSQHAAGADALSVPPAAPANLLLTTGTTIASRMPPRQCQATGKRPSWCDLVRNQPWPGRTVPNTAQQFLMDLYKLELSETSNANERLQAASRGAQA